MAMALDKKVKYIISLGHGDSSYLQEELILNSPSYSWGRLLVLFKQPQ